MPGINGRCFVVRSLLRFPSLPFGIIPIAVILFLSITACNDKPTTPVTAKEYIVYFIDGFNDSTFFEFHPSTGILDSFILPYKSNLGFGIEISPDGRWMYLPTTNSIVVVDLATHTATGEYSIEIGGEVILSKDGMYLAVMQRTLQVPKLSIYNTDDFSVVHSETLFLSNAGIFSDDSREFFCTEDDNNTPGSSVYKVDLSANVPVVSRKHFDKLVADIIPSLDKTQWFINHQSGEYCDLLVYDVPRDSIIYSRRLVPSIGDMALFPNGRLLVYSQPWHPQYYSYPPEYFSIFDVERRIISRLVSLYEYSDPLFIHTSKLCITPDGNRLIGAPHLVATAVFVYNLEEMRFERFTPLNGPRDISKLWVQRQP